MANSIKMRIEIQLEAGDLVPPGEALGASLEALATRLAAEETTPTSAVLDVPRGQAAYLVEVRYGK